MKLTATEVKAAKPAAKRYKMFDGQGLILFVEASGSKIWRFRFKRDGREVNTTLGKYPEMSLIDARAKTLEVKRSGVDPVTYLEREKTVTSTAPNGTFAELAARYMAREKPHWAAGHYERFSNRMSKDVLPIIGDMPVAEIKPVDVIRAIAPIEARGAQDTAVRVVGMVGQVMRYAVAKGFAERDVTADLKGGLDRPPPVKHMAAVTDRKELGDLLTDIWDWAGDTYAKPFLQLCAYLFQRPGEIAGMRWADVDFERGVWTYRVSKVGVDHAVPLPSQAIAILRDLHAMTGNYPFVFYSISANSGFMSHQLGVKLLGKIGWRQKHTPHGFRATARTLIAEDLEVEPRLIEQQLSHTVAEAHGRAYNRTQYIKERTAMVQRYADHLDNLRALQA
ncbi:MAG: integrase arm-type DNA-binding domain-containing protein [Tateyamaria sp.]|uniref:tyrosine-type recombinase/integrase n=1 Tax=Tateyamaria sp. TaxID=1929288 RepID=UPI0032A0EED9